MSGGGLASGVAAVLKAADPRIKVVACRPRWVQRLAGTLAAPAADEGVLLMVDEVVEVAEEEAARAVVDTVSHCGQQVDGELGVGLQRGPAVLVCAQTERPALLWVDC